MPRRRPPLPPALVGQPFAVARALEVGVPPHRLRPGDLHVVARGARAPGPPTTLDELARAVACALPPPFAFSHLTAARLWQLPLPRRWSLSEAVHVVRPTEGAQVRRPGVVGHRGLEVRQVVELRGLPVTGPVSTLLDLAALPRTRVEDLVVATDAFVARDPRLLDEVVAAASERKPRRRGIRALRAALALVRVGSGSPMETKARLGFLRVGLPEPELNAELFHPDDGQFIARVDFLWRKARVVGEFEGDHHRTDRRQWQMDIARTRLLESLGWTVVRMTSADLATPHAWAQLTARLRALIAAAGNE